MKETTSEWKARKEAEKAEAEKAFEEPTSFKVPVYASVSRSALEMYVDGNTDSIDDWRVSLRVGTAPTDYNDYSDYMPVGIVTIKIPSKHQRIQAELLAIDVEIEAQRKKSIERLEELNDRRQTLLAIPHLVSVE